MPSYQELTLRKLQSAIEVNATQLNHMFGEHTGAAVAWTARNLLELYIWTTYCLASEANAQCFYEDSIRDTLDMLKRPSSLSTTGTFDFMAERDRLIKKVEADTSITNAGRKPLAVRDAATAIGYADFSSENKLFSKYTHPTAFMVMNPEHDETLKQKFLDAGLLFANEAYGSTVTFLKTGLSPLPVSPP